MRRETHSPQKCELQEEVHKQSTGWVGPGGDGSDEQRPRRLRPGHASARPHAGTVTATAVEYEAVLQVRAGSLANSEKESGCVASLNKRGGERQGVYCKGRSGPNQQAHF